MIAKRFILSMCIIGIACFSITGCAKKKVTTDKSAISPEDIPLSEININFYEPKGVVEFQDVHFDYNKSDIRNDSKAILKNIASWMKKNPEKHVMVEGHCDERGSKEYNLALGEYRALAVRRYISNWGVGANKIHTISYGEEYPADRGHDKKAWDKNRRAHFLISQ
ncbi:MAG: peptidoglycan-associated lipoprotein Pal [Candidatus Ancaeobacter aquaticus]|nr:peptidoglycan-associated lipoprotein Pal [Candidatus Ancaeobacter aquaticus]